MINELRTIKYLRTLRKKEINENFLACFKVDLKEFMTANPARVIPEKNLLEKSRVFFAGHFSLSGLRFAPAFIMIALLIILSGGGVALAAQGSLPGESLYPVKVLTENIQSVLTINPEAKEKLNVALAAKRVEEIKTLVTKKNADPVGINIALTRLGENMADASRIIDEQKNTGQDVTQLVNTASTGFNLQDSALEQVLNAQKNALDIQKNKIENKIKDMSGLNIAASDATSTIASSSDILSQQLRQIAERSRRINDVQTQAMGIIFKHLKGFERFSNNGQTTPDNINKPESQNVSSETENTSSTTQQNILPTTQAAGQFFPTDHGHAKTNAGHSRSRGKNKAFQPVLNATSTDDSGLSTSTSENAGNPMHFDNRGAGASSTPSTDVQQQPTFPEIPPLRVRMFNNKNVRPNKWQGNNQDSLNENNN